MQRGSLLSCFISFVFLLCFICNYSAKAQLKIPGQSYFGSNNYTEYIYGSLPIIIGAPHDGTVSPSNIPDRTDSLCGTAVTTVSDLNCKRIARSLDTSLNLLMGGHPHTVICLIHRKKVDVNRDLPEAACGNTTAEGVWHDYMDFMDTAHRSVIRDFGRGLFIDIHGHGHPISRNEIGYLLYGSTLRQSDSFLNTASIVDVSSINYLVNNNLTGQTHAQLIRGASAFGTLLGNAGYPSVPSQQIPYPDSGQAYFDGGYNTARWTSRDSGSIDGFQIETYYTGLRDNWHDIRAFTDSLAVVIQKYLHNMFSQFTLPLLLLDVRGYATPDGNQLSWTVLNEAGVKEYVIQRSNDGKMYDSIAYINCEQLKEYGYTDNYKGEGYTFYRIKSFRIDGSSTLSKVVCIRRNKVQIIEAYPNPASNAITIEHARANTGATINLYNSNGQIARRIRVREGCTSTRIDSHDLTAGIYLLRYNDGSTSAGIYIITGGRR